MGLEYEDFRAGCRKKQPGFLCIMTENISARVRLIKTNEQKPQKTNEAERKCQHCEMTKLEADKRRSFPLMSAIVCYRFRRTPVST